MQYKILECNMDRVRKTMTRVQNKCRKYGCDFRFEEVGEEFRTVKDVYGETSVRRYVIVEAEGKAEINGWRFIAKVEHTENGNLIQKAVDVEVPDRYYTTAPVCEHCGTKRVRKDTYIVQNIETGEFKQVGKSCLKDFTNGMSAEGVASYAAAFDELICGEAPFEGCSIERYIEVGEYLRYVAETVRHFGFVKTSEAGYDVRSTAGRAMDYFGVDHGWFWRYGDKKMLENLKAEMEACGFDAERKESVELVENALVWIGEQEESNNYMHNLKVVCADRYCKRVHSGLLASLIATYNREMGYIVKKEKEAEARKISNWVANVGDRITVKVQDFECVASWETEYAYGRTVTVKIYKITDENGNVFVWKTQNWLENPDEIKGTVKEHKEYKGEKQTEITRCKVTEKAIEPEVHKEPGEDVSKYFSMEWFEAAAE